METRQDEPLNYREEGDRHGRIAALPLNMEVAMLLAQMRVATGQTEDPQEWIGMTLLNSLEDAKQ